MSRWVEFLVVVLIVFATGPVFAQAPNSALQPATAFATAPEIPYDSAGANYLKFPAGLYLGEAMGVARNSKGQILVFTRSGEATRLFQFDPEGNFLREIGQGLYGFAMAHAVRVDSQDNIWAVDEGTDMVIKFNPEGRVVMLLGRAAGIWRGPDGDTPEQCPASFRRYPIDSAGPLTLPGTERETFSSPMDIRIQES